MAQGKEQPSEAEKRKMATGYRSLYRATPPPPPPSP